MPSQSQDSGSCCCSWSCTSPQPSVKQPPPCRVPFPNHISVLDLPRREVKAGGPLEPSETSLDKIASETLSHKTAHPQSCLHGSGRSGFWLCSNATQAGRHTWKKLAWI
jgi:hypothetical protein